MKKTRFLVLASSALCLVGCSGSPQTANVSVKNAQVPQSNVAKSPTDQPMQEMGDNVKGGASVIHDPAQAQPGGSYRIEPADPNDPHFKPDPKLGGG
jgi:PBP1b-binding outer membrane lipoprotein LpoB